MRRCLRSGLIIFLSLISLSCRAEDGPRDVRYGLVAYDLWPVFIFYRINNSKSASLGQYVFAASNGGWTSSMGSAPIRNLRNIDDRFERLEFDFIWKEEETQRAYEAKISIKLSDLKPDPISPEMGTLIFRFARGGDVQAVTYEPSMESTDLKPIEIARACGNPVEISDSGQLREMEKLSDHWKSDGGSYSTAPENVPSRCE